MAGGLGDWLDERTGWRAALTRQLDAPVAGGASFAHVFGVVLGFVLALEATTGVLLAFYYAPSTSAAWASVARIEDGVSLGWLVRGLHLHGASAMVIVAGLHLLQTAAWGAYRRPRELTWIVGVLLLGLIVAFSLTGHLLPWDQAGYWATKVELGIAAATPVVGDKVVQALQGGNDFGNLTLTRYHALHVFVLPALTIGLALAHRALVRRHGATPAPGGDAMPQPYWPEQSFRDALAITLVLAALVAWTVHAGGAPLAAPADPTSAFDARPEWFIRPLYQLRVYAGSWEVVAALGAPAIALGFLVLLPLLDRADRPARRRPLLAALFGGFAATAALVAISFQHDATDAELAKSQRHAAMRADEARVLAAMNGVPAAGGTAVFETAPFWRARVIWKQACAHCHEGDKREGPAIGPGYDSRAYVRAFLVQPGDDLFYGRTKLAHRDGAMKAVDQTGADLDALVELVYAETGATDVDAAKVARGRAIFDDTCSDCHEREAGKESTSAPNLFGRGSPAWLEGFLATPGGATYFFDRNEMPAKVGAELTADERRQLAQYLTWLRHASDVDLKALGEP